MTKPIHALTAYVPTDVWRCLLPRSRQCAPGSLLPFTPPFCPEYRFSSDRMWRWVGEGVIHICDSFDTWQRKYADGGWAPRNLFKITRLRAMAPPREYEWRREINATASPSPLALCYLFTFHSVSTQPLRCLCQTWQMQGEGSYRWIWLPPLSFPMPRCGEIKSVCNVVCDGKGQLVNQPVFLLLFFCP